MNEEMRKIISDICPFYKEYGSCEQCNTELDTDDEPCYYKCMANVIINNGYCKASDIFAEVEMVMLDGAIGGRYPVKVINPDKYAELKKKYTEEIKNDSKQK